MKIETTQFHKKPDNSLLMQCRTYNFENGYEIAAYIAREKYAWPGGYELFAITDDGGILCNDCCKSEYYLIRTSYPGDGWHVSAYDYAANLEEPEHCSHCNKDIS